VSVGIDIVSTRRAGHWRAHPDGQVLVLSETERVWIESEVLVPRVLVCLSVKESFVKAIGARPPDWDWRSVSFVAGDTVASGDWTNTLFPGIGEILDAGEGTCAMTPATGRFAAECMAASCPDELLVTAAWAATREWVATMVRCATPVTQLAAV
jgi:hypothetical protein